MKKIIMVSVCFLLLGITSVYAEVKKEFYDNGKVRSEATYDSNKVKDGVEKLYTIQGVLADEITWDHGIAKLDKKYYDSGELGEEIHLNGPAVTDHEGLLTLYYKNGAILNTVTYNAAHNKDGVEKSFNTANVLVDEVTWVNGIAKLDKKYYDSGELGQRIRLNGPATNNYEGVFTTYYKNGAIMNTVNYNAAHNKNGVERSYDPAKVLVDEVTWVNGIAKLDKKYYNSGELGQKIHLNGPAATNYEGAFTTYYQNGKVKSTGNYNAANLKDGVFKEFDINGSVTSALTYKNGELVGK